MHSVRNLLICGLLAGACAGILAAGVAKIAGEPAIGSAIVFEEGHQGEAHHAGAGHGAAPHTHDHGEEAPVSRDVQSTIGLLAAAVIFGVSVGGLYALAFSVVYGRVGRGLSPQKTALLLAAAAFVVIYLVPFLKYPANPPSVGSPETIGERTLLYLVMVAISLLAAIAAVRLRRLLACRFSGFGATAGAVVSYLVIVAVAAIALPAINEVPADFPATTLWDFRIAALGMQAVLWTTIGLVFAPLATGAMTSGRSLRGSPPTH